MGVTGGPLAWGRHPDHRSELSTHSSRGPCLEQTHAHGPELHRCPWESPGNRGLVLKGVPKRIRASGARGLLLVGGRGPRDSPAPPPWVGQNPACPPQGISGGTVMQGLHGAGGGGCRNNLTERRWPSVCISSRGGKGWPTFLRQWGGGGGAAWRAGAGPRQEVRGLGAQHRA